MEHNREAQEPAAPPEDQEVAEEQEGEEDESLPIRSWLLLLLIVVVFGWLAYRSYPAHHVAKKDPGFLDNVFANNIVLFAARLVLFSAAFVLAVMAVYVIFSVVKGMLAGQILTKFGPLEMQAVQDLSADVEMWQESWAEANEENEGLRQRLAETDTLFGQLYAAYQEAIGGTEEEERPHG